MSEGQWRCSSLGNEAGGLTRTRHTNRPVSMRDGSGKETPKGAGAINWFSNERKKKCDLFNHICGFVS